MTKFFKLLAITISTLTFSASSLAQTSAEVGRDYEITAPKTDSGPLLEEFFNYACAACYRSEEFINNLKTNNPGLKFRAVPVEFRPAWEIYVKAYYLGEKLGLLDKSHAKIFHRIHVEKKPFNNESEMKAFFVSLGATEKAYDDIANSFSIDVQMRKAKQYTIKHKITNTPTLLVNKRYRLLREGYKNLPRLEQIIQELSGLN
ncbi:MAG: thiol:disulfide interchange protein DsbA/DsbL [Oceanospirillaceae bacterium]|nr:thiol:disulfide interchange protein DsbA/DsbL [Oceanospirillaceae bacterium]